MWHWWYFNFPGKVQFGVKEKRFGIRVFCVHGGSNREEITRFAVKRLNVPLLATVTVMPHTTFPLALLTHSHMTWWYHNIWWFLILSTLFELHSIIVLFPHFFISPSFILSQEGSPVHWATQCTAVVILGFWSHSPSSTDLNCHERQMKCVSEYFCLAQNIRKIPGIRKARSMCDLPWSLVRQTGWSCRAHPVCSPPLPSYAHLCPSGPS